MSIVLLILLLILAAGAGGMVALRRAKLPAKLTYLLIAMKALLLAAVSVILLGHMIPDEYGGLATWGAIGLLIAYCVGAALLLIIGYGRRPLI